MYEEYTKQDPYTKEKYPQSIYHNQPNPAGGPPSRATGTTPLKWVANPAIRRVGAEEKVTGKEIFGNDIVFPGMLYLKIKRCPYSHAVVKSINTTAAKALPGVVMVLTNDDIPDLINAAPYDYCLNKECWVEGMAVACVAAEEEDIAEEAIDLIEVTYDVLPFVLHQDDALKAGAYILHGDTNEVGTAVSVKRGDVDAGFAQSTKVVGPDHFTTVTKPFYGVRPVAGVENESFTARWQNDRMSSWVSQQSPWGVARTVASTLGLPYNKVIGRNCRQGTGWGSKGSDGAGIRLAAYVSYKTDRPCKWYQDSDGYFCLVTSAWTCQEHTLKTGMKDDGTVVAISDVSLGNAGYRGSRAVGSSMQQLETKLTCPNLSCEGKDVWTNSQSAGVPRCVAHPSGSWAFAVHNDRCAEKVNQDPIDWWIKNCFTGSGLGGHPDNPAVDIGANPQPDIYPQLITLSGWKTKWKGWTTPVSVSGAKRRGIGFAQHNCSHGSLSNPESATIMAEGDGTFRCVTGSNECGNGARTAMTIMAAEEMGVNLKNMFCPNFDTDQVQESRSPGGSTVVRGTGTAIILACRDAKEQLFKMAIAAKKIDATSPEQLETGDDKIYVKADPTKSVAIKDITALQSSTYVDAETGTSFGGPIIGRGRYATKRSGATMMNMQHSGAVAEVEVDTDTGEVTVLNVWEVAADGRSIYLMGEFNQTWSGIIMQVGHALYEGVIKDEPTGITLNPNYSLYKLPTMADNPNMFVEFYNEIDPYGPFGAKGSGEPVMPPTTAAVLNAIYNACGVRLYQTHVTPDTILAGLGKA